VASVRGQGRERARVNPSQFFEYVTSAFPSSPKMVQVRIQLRVGWRWSRRSIPSFFKHVKKTGLSVHAVLYVPLKRSTCWLPIGPACVAHIIQHLRSLARFLPFPGDISAKEPCLCCFRIGLADVDEMIFCSRKISPC
jgi:hypothetical protein